MTATRYVGERETGYYENTRQDIVDALPRPLGRVLDVGCGAGGVGPGLRAAGAESLTGVEMMPSAAAQARETYDDVVEGTIEEALSALNGPFDTVLCLDVLEHLVDPAAVVEGLFDVTCSGGHLQVSVPNARQVSLPYDLLVRGTFGYTEFGHRDATHLRWFTIRDMVALLEDRGWRVVDVSHPAFRPNRKWAIALDKLTGGFTTQFLVWQIYVRALKP